MINTYPLFSKLDISHLEEITAFTARFEPYSDFNFTSLFCWNIDGSTEVSWLNGNLVISLPDYLDGHKIYSILGDQRVDESILSLTNRVGRLQLVPEVVIASLQRPTDFRIIEDEDNFDYVYQLGHLSELAGVKFKKKRNKANVFVKDHEQYELVVNMNDKLDTSQLENLKQVDRHWATQNPRDEGDILAERKALAKLLDNSSAFKLIITEVVVNGDIKAFSINEVLSNGYAICHFEKALKFHHEHLNTFLAREVAKQLKAAGCDLVNWEQDLGLEGLRRSKQSYHPIKMLKKYTVSAHGHVSAQGHNN